MDPKKKTEISAIGRFSLAEKILASHSENPAPADDAVVIPAIEGEGLLSNVLLLEGVDFDLTYFPLKHLGYKTVVAAVSSVLAMNGTPRRVMVSLGVSARMSVEMIEEYHAGVRQACEDYALVFAGGGLNTSLTGFTISATVFGEAKPEKLTRRSGAQVNDLICITGDLGAAYMGLRLLDREKRVLAGHDNPQPQFAGYEYLLRRQLKPRARIDVTAHLAETGLVPTSMVLLKDGLASDLIHLCKASGTGARIYLDRIPIASETYKLCEEMHTDPVVAALNGGEDYELLFTVPLALQQKITDIGGIDVIGHITAPEAGVKLVTPDGGEINITAPGWTALV